jgi:hypothetical protein
MSTPADQLGQDRSVGVAQAAQRQTALDATRQASGAAREKELQPLEQKVSTGIDSLQSMTPPPKAALPTYEPKPLVDPKEYQQLSMGLIGMALIGGIASKGNWMGTSAALNGALKGYMEGNQEQAEKGYRDYQTKFKEAQSKSEAEQKEFESILQNKRLSINDMLAQVKLAAAKYGRDDVRMEAEQKSIDGIWKRVETMDSTIARISDQDQRQRASLDAMFDRQSRTLDAALAKAKEGAGGNLPDLARDIKTELTVRGVTLPQGTRSAKTLNATLTNLANKYPDKPASEIVDMIKSGQIDMKVAMGEAGVLAKREGNIEPAMEALNQKGGLYDQLTDAAKAVNFGDSKDMNDWRLAAQGKHVANPAIQRLRNLITDTQAEVVTVLSRSGQPTESVRQQAADMFPLNGSVPEIETAIAASKKVASAIEQGNETVLSALKSGKSVREAAALADKPAGAGAAPAPYADPGKEQRYQEWKRAHPTT